MLTQCCHVASARFGDYLYVRTIRRLSSASRMLFNLKEDPHQQHNLAEEHPELCAQGARIVLD